MYNPDNYLAEVVETLRTRLLANCFLFSADFIFSTTLADFKNPIKTGTGNHPVDRITCTSSPLFDFTSILRPSLLC